MGTGGPSTPPAGAKRRRVGAHLESKDDDADDAAWPDYLFPGNEIDALDATNKWLAATVVDLDEEHERVFVHYRYWPSSHDEWIRLNSSRVAPRGQRAWLPGNPFVAGQWLDLYDRVSGAWVEGTIEEVQTRSNAGASAAAGGVMIQSDLHVHFQAQGEWHREWIALPTQRIAPYESKRREPQPCAHATNKSAFWRRRGRHAAVPVPLAVPYTGRSSTAARLRRPGQGGAGMQGLSTGMGTSAWSSLLDEEHAGEATAARGLVLGPGTGGTPSTAGDDTMVGEGQGEGEGEGMGAGAGGPPGGGEDMPIPASAVSDPRLAAYLTALATRGLGVVSMGGDGNCLFRSVADQVYGNQELHALVRGIAARYMKAEAAFYAPFVVGEDASAFTRYVEEMSTAGIWGDDPEVQALCEVYNRPAEIWAFDANRGARLLRTFNSAAADAAADTRPPIRLSYYGGGHYDSVRGVDWEGNLLRSRPGEVESRVLLAANARNTAGAAGAARSVLQQSDVEATEAAALAAALAASRADFQASTVREAGNLELALLASLKEGAEAGITGQGAGDTVMGTSSSAGAPSSLPLPSSFDLPGIGSGSGSGSGVSGFAGASASASATTSATGPAAARPVQPQPDLESTILAQAMQASLAAQAAQADEEVRLAMEVSRREAHAGVGGAGGAGMGAVPSFALPAADEPMDLFDAAIALTEDEQLECVLLGMDARAYAMQKKGLGLGKKKEGKGKSKGKGGAGAGGGAASTAGAPAAGSSSAPEAPHGALAGPSAAGIGTGIGMGMGMDMDEEEQALQMALLLSQQR